MCVDTDSVVTCASGRNSGADKLGCTACFHLWSREHAPSISWVGGAWGKANAMEANGLDEGDTALERAANAPGAQLVFPH